MVCMLKKSLYGLKQSPRCWYKQFNEYIIKDGFKRSEYDHCIYLKGVRSKYVVYLLLYMDDMLVASRSKVEVLRVKA